jgi:hypothetical protein
MCMWQIQFNLIWLEISENMLFLTETIHFVMSSVAFTEFLLRIWRIQFAHRFCIDVNIYLCTFVEYVFFQINAWLLIQIAIFIFVPHSTLLSQPISSHKNCEFIFICNLVFIPNVTYRAKWSVLHRLEYVPGFLRWHWGVQHISHWLHQ